jgi:hypothetical protein
MDICEQENSLPQTLDELVHTIKAEAVLSRVTDIHRHVL